eukprot:COSAG05_NODE_7422_length_813_cov_0.717087_1_plen_167_part_01
MWLVGFSSPAAPPPALMPPRVLRKPAAEATAHSEAGSPPRRTPPPPAPLMTVGDVPGGEEKYEMLTAFLEEVHLERYKELLIEHQTDMETLLMFTEDDLKELGIAKGPRIKIIRKAQEWAPKNLAAMRPLPLGYDPMASPASDAPSDPRLTPQLEPLLGPDPAREQT